MTHAETLQAKAERKARAAAQREDIRQAVVTGYPDSVRQEIRKTVQGQDAQIAAEVRLQDRAARVGIADA